LPPQLKELNLSKNALSASDLSCLLDDFHRLAQDRSYSLTRLLLANNQLTTLPLSLLSHPQLREIQVSASAPRSPSCDSLTPPLSLSQLSFNRLTTLQSLNFAVLQQLEILDLSNNKLLSLGNVFTATSLRVLLLENNELDSLPSELCYLTNLQTLSLHGNPQRSVRQAVLQKGVNAILAVSRSDRELDTHLSPSLCRPSKASWTLRLLSEEAPLPPPLL
jgi:leucine-rich repeat protein SHOC2